MAELTAAMQKKWGEQAVRQGSLLHLSSLSPLSTSFHRLDALLNGGIVPGEITQYHGVETSGTTTLALKTIAQAQKKELRVIYIDPMNIFSPKYAADLGVNLEDLLLVRWANEIEGIEIATDMINRYGVGLVVFGHGGWIHQAGIPSSMRRLVNSLRRSSCAFISLNRCALPHQSPFHPHASTQLQLKRLRWLERWGVVGGYLVRVNVVKYSGRDGHNGVTLRLDLP